MAEEEKPAEAAGLWNLLDALRKPFKAEVYGKLFKAFNKEESKRAPKATCRECGSYHSTAKGVHLDYVGHAAVTDRLLSVDPEWTWEPLANTPEGMPLFLLSQAGYPIGLWIKLTVCGVTRLGFGSVAGDAFDPEKQLIGDALRNAAMRFGVGLDLWSKEELESELDSEDVSPVRKEKRAAKGPLAETRDKHTRDESPLMVRGSTPAAKEEDRMVAETARAFGGEVVGEEPSGADVRRAFGMDEEGPAVVDVLGIPCSKSYAEIATEYVGGKSAFKDKLWREMAAGAPKGKAEAFLSKHHEVATAGYADGGDPTPVQQAAILTLAEMFRLRKAKDAEQARAIDLIPARKREA